MKLKYPTLFSLYIAQSIPMSFFSTVVPVIMRQESYSLESIGLLQLIKLPWILKFLWAPLVDNKVTNKRQLRRWIIASELFYAMVVLSIGFFQLETNFSLIVALMMIAITASATQDIATDIFAIRILKPDEKCVGNGIQSAGSFVGSLFGAGVLLLAYHYFGWTALLILLASFVAFAILPLLFYRPELISTQLSGQRAGLRDIISFFHSPFSRKRLFILIFYYSGLMGILTMLKPWMVDLGYDVKEIGIMSGIVGTATAATASMAGGFLVRWVGRKASFYLFAFLNLAAALFFVYIAGHTPTLVELYVGICLLWGAYGLSMVIIFTSSMDAVRTHSAGTDFTVQIVVTQLSAMVLGALSGKIAGVMGYQGLFVVEVALAIISILLLLWVYPLRKKTTLIV